MGSTTARADNPSEFSSSNVMLLDDLCVESPPIAEKAEVFVSYTGQYKFRFFVESLQGLRGKALWTDLFCVDQFGWSGGKGTATLEKCRNGLLHGLCSSIREIGSVVLLLERWNDVVDTVGQSWVFWEIFNAVRANASIRLVLTAAERTRNNRRRILGDEHMHTLTSINNMACCLKAQGKLEDAEPLYREALNTCRRILGDDHPDTLWSINNMAGCLKEQGKLEDAEPLYREVVDDSRRILGDDHPRTVTSIHNMTCCLQAQGKLEDAGPLYRETTREHWRSSVIWRRVCMRKTSGRKPKCCTKVNCIAGDAFSETTTRVQFCPSVRWRFVWRPRQAGRS